MVKSISMNNVNASNLSRNRAIIIIQIIPFSLYQYMIQNIDKMIKKSHRNSSSQSLNARRSGRMLGDSLKTSRRGSISSLVISNFRHGSYRIVLNRFCFSDQTLVDPFFCSNLTSPFSRRKTVPTTCKLNSVNTSNWF